MIELGECMFEDSFRVERSITIQSPPNKIYPFINDFHNWEQWSPYEKLDPSMIKKYEGPQSGVGSAYEWNGSNKVGSGRMEITASSSEKISLKLDFTRPMVAHNMTDFLLEKIEDGTKVTWAMYGTNNFMGKVMSIFMSMDKLVGKDFEKGLANLKSLIEK